MDPEQPSGARVPREGYMPIGDASLYYRDVGQGTPIILLHGGPRLDHNYFLPDMDRLADAFHLIYYDQRGRGKSARNVQPADVSIRSEIDDLDRLRAHFRLESIVVLGHSWGTLLALEYAMRHPDRVSHLILLNSTPASQDDLNLFQQARLANAPEDAEILRVLASRPAFAAGDLEARAAYYRVYFRTTLRPPALLDRLIEHLQVGWTKEGVLKAGAIAERLWNETYESSGYNMLPRLARLSIPTLIVHGDHDFVPVACAGHLAEAIPGARLVVLRDCGHFSYLERPDEVRKALGDFLRAS